MPPEGLLFIVIETVVLVLGIVALIKIIFFNIRCPNCKRRNWKKTGEVRRATYTANLEEEYQCQECGHTDWKP